MTNLPTRGIGLTGGGPLLPSFGLGLGPAAAAGLTGIRTLFIALRIGV